MARQTAAEKAFKSAQKAIAQAAKSEATELRLSGAAFRALDRLPEEIAGLTGLTKLDLWGTKIVDLEPLRGLTGLKRLDLLNIGVSDLEPLRGLTGLTALYLRGAEVSDLEPLQGLTGLAVLYLRGAGVNDLGPLRGLTGLTRLDLSGAGVSDLEPLRGLTGLKRLDLLNIGVSDLEPLRGLTRLTELSLMITNVSDLEPLRGLTGLTGLDLSDSKVRDLEPLRGLTGLKRLDLRGTEVSDLEPLRGMTGLTQLDLSGTEVSDLEPLRGMTGLTRLKLSGTGVSRDALQAGLRGKTSLIPPEEWFPRSGAFGVHLKDCRAAREDARIAEIARIEDHRERTIALFEELGLEWRDVAPELSPQSDSGLRYAPDETGVISYDPAAAVVVQDAQQRQLHVLLREDADELLILFGGGHNQPFARVTRKLQRYSTGLGDDLDRLNPSLLWKTGNDLRLILQADKERRPGDMTNQLAFDVDQRAGLEGLISAHNALVALHPALSKLDEVSVDPALRHVAERDRALMQAAIDAFAEQTRLIMAEVVGDLRNLHEEAMGETRAAIRAGRIEVESLENLIKAIITEAILEARGESTLSKLAGDVRATAVGTVAVGAATLAGPQIAATYPQLVAALQPTIAALMAAWHGKDYPVSQAVEWVMRRFRG